MSVEGAMIYRGYRIAYDPKPIPDRSHDWDWVHVEYDGPEDRRCGTAASIEAAKREIDEQTDAEAPHV